MKIALVCFARRGGMVHFHAELANALAPITPVVAVGVADTDAAYYSRKLSRIKVDVGQGVFHSLWTAANPFTWARLGQQLRLAEVDMLHVVAAHEWNPFLALLARLMHLPLIYTVHDPVPHRGAPILMRLSDAIVARVAAARVALTRYGRSQLIARGFAVDTVFLIPHGMYTFFTKHVRARTPQENLIVCLGRMETYKGLDILLSAFAKVAASLPDWRLLISGSGRLPEAARQLDTPQVEIVNRYISDREFAQTMQRARLVVLPYSEATQSGVVAAAFAFGRAVIVTRVGGLPEMVDQGKTGLLIAPGDVGALAHAIKKLASDPRRLDRMGRQALLLGRLRWSWDHIAHMHLNMYKTVRGEGRGS